METLIVQNATYRLATKNNVGEVVQFGPVMSLAIAERKRKAMAALTEYPVYIVNTRGSNYTNNERIKAMQNAITDITEIRDAIRDNFNGNAIVEYILDEFLCDGNYSDVDSLITDLELAHCAAGSFSGMIYTGEILDRLSDSDWCNAIEQAIEDYTDAVGESPNFDRDAMGYPAGFRLENLVTFAVDWTSNEIASFLRYHGQFFIVTQCVDSLDPSPERKVFLCEYEAQEYVSESLQHRMDYIVQHSPHSISESEYEELQEQEQELIKLESESV